MAPEFDEFIRRALEADPKRRIASVAEFAAQLEALPEKTPVG